MTYAGQARIGDGQLAAAEIELSDDALDIAVDGAAPFHLQLVDIEDVHDQDYVLRLTDHEGVAYELTMLGKAYGQLLAELRARRDAVLERDLLLKGVKLQDSFPAKLFGGDAPLPVQVRLYEDLLVVVPERGTMFGVPFSFIERIGWDEELYQVHVETDDGQRLLFGHLARRSEEFRDELRRLLAGLARRTAATLGRLLPGTDAEMLGRLAELMRDGRAAQRWQLDEVDPEVWPRLEAVAAPDEARRATYDLLAARTMSPWAAFGVKAVGSEEEAPGDDSEPVAEGAETAAAPIVAGDVTDLWYFCPLTRDGRPVNAVAQEVASRTGHATYVFRLMDPARFRAASGDEFAAEVARSIARLNRALLLLNFRREPIYLPEEEISSGEHVRYRVALRKLDYLREARAAFLGRAVHNASWEAQIDDLVSRA